MQRAVTLSLPLRACAAFGASGLFIKAALSISLVTSRQISQECDCGKLASMILNPSEIKYEKIVTNMTRFKKNLGSVVKKSIEKMKRFRKKQNGGSSNSGKKATDGNEEPSVTEKWTFACEEKKVPVVACVNSKSGGLKGEEVLASFYKYLNPLQVVSVIHEGLGALNKFKDFPKWRIVVAGGDGTIASVLNYVYDTLKPKYYPEVSLIPLGTGNDLSQVLGWGKTISDTDVYDYLLNLEGRSMMTLLDRWKVTLTYQRQEKVWQGLKREAKVKTVVESSYMYNYLGLGIDAKITKDFHTLREQYPSLFSSRLLNKFIYSQAGTRELIMGACRNMHQKIKLFCNDKEIALPYIEGLTVINITSQAGGTDYWGNHLPEIRGFSHQSISDQVIEAVGVSGTLHIGQCMIGLDGGLRLCQGNSIRIQVDPKQNVPIQIDGEPLMKQDGIATIDIKFDQQVKMTKQVMSNATAMEKKCYDVISWAREKNHITEEQARIIENELAKKFNT
eukprot:TRINITY_DN1994_c0_g1_i5.p1 TRINITY_DN1994_c0_g1~~TRINITY_DN1994_c0_g1_i5.p1  ORF type:complete len:505 (-),score=150.65 TRINITY_DN1994_c0_g1_i5:111-1625(-)